MKNVGYSGKITTRTAIPGTPGGTTEMITGVNSKINGIDDWNTIDETYGIGREVRYTDIKYPVLWKALSDRNKTIGTYGWWAAWPPADINGFTFNTELVPDSRDTSRPVSLNNYFDKNKHETENAFSIIDNFTKKYNEDSLPDFMALAFHRIDINQHMMWVSIQPDFFKKYFDNLPENFSEKYGIENNNSFIAKEYIMIDDFVNKTIEMYSRDNENFYIILVSDHGFQSVHLTAQTDLYPFLKDVGLMNYTLQSDIFGRYTYRAEPGTKLKREPPLIPRSNSNIKYEGYDENGTMIYQKLDEDFTFGDEPFSPDEAIAFLGNITYKCSGMNFFENVTYNEDLGRIQADRITDFRCLDQMEIKYDYVDDASSKGNFFFIVLKTDLILPNGTEYEFELGPLKTGCHPIHKIYGIFLAYTPKIQSGENIGIIETIDIAPTIYNLFGINCAHCEGKIIDIEK